MNVRGTTLFGVGVTLYAISTVVDSTVEKMVNLPIPLTSVVIGLLFGFLPLWGCASIYLFDVGSSLVGALVDYPKLQAYTFNAIQISRGIGSQVDSGGLGFQIPTVVLYIGLALLGVLLVWRWRVFLELLKNMLIMFSITTIMVIGPTLYAAFMIGQKRLPLDGDIIAVSNLMTGFALTFLLWMLIVGPFVSYAIFRYIGLFKRVRAVVLH
jgi:hypothetical protein